MKLLQKIRNTLFCSKDKHNWEHCIAGNRIISVEGEEGYYFADIPMRHCKDCDVSEERWFDGEWRRYHKGNNKVSRDVIGGQRHEIL